MKHKILLITLLMLFATSAFSQIPQTMSYQGVLADEAGNAVADGSYVLNCALYETAEGGTAIWQETQEVAAENGLFNVLLGRVEPLTLDFDDPFWLGITIGSDAELQPRIELASSPYSLQALSVADSAVTGKSIATGHVVRSLNGARDEVTLMAGENISISAQGQELMISASGILGTDGRNCWDLNGNGQGDPEEDTNGDGNFNAEDCKGAKGDQGDKGDKGDQGGQGGQGDKGDKGDQGGQGDKGDKGDQGGQGDKGDKGVQGDKGDKGTQGSSGTSSWADGAGKVATNATVLIGTTVPSLGAKLDVIASGQVAVSGSGEGATGVLAISDTQPGLFSTSNSGTGVFGASTFSFGGDFLGAENNGSKAALRVRSGSQTLLLDGNEIDALADALFLNSNSSHDVILANGGGNVGIGTTNPNVPLHIANGSDVTGTGGGRFLLGSAIGSGLRMDGNEIQAFTSGTSKNATLFLQHEGDGNVDLGDGALYVKSDSKVGIGTTSPNFLLHVNGSAGKPGGGSWSSASDARLKDIKGHFTRGLDTIDKLNPVYYSYKKDNPINLPSDEKYIGLIAQQVQKVIPEAVGEYEDGYLSVNNDPIIWTMLNAIKELKAENKATREELSQTKAELNDLKTKVNKLESLFSQTAMLNK